MLTLFCVVVDAPTMQLCLASARGRRVFVNSTYKHLSVFLWDSIEQLELLWCLKFMSSNIVGWVFFLSLVLRATGMGTGYLLRGEGRSLFPVKKEEQEVLRAGGAVSC